MVPGSWKRGEPDGPVAVGQPHRAGKWESGLEAGVVGLGGLQRRARRKDRVMVSALSSSQKHPKQVDGVAGGQTQLCACKISCLGSGLSRLWGIKGQCSCVQMCLKNESLKSEGMGGGVTPNLRKEVELKVWIWTKSES